MQLVIAPMQPDDWAAVEAIYCEGIATGNATFETEAPDWATWDTNHLPHCRLVARDDDGTIIAWAALSKVSSRYVYRGVAEVSIYIAEAVRGQGVGKRLMNRLIEASEAVGFWTLQSTILRENEISIGFHRACGFREVGYRERVGQRDGVWRDTVLMERRSSVVGR